MEIENDPKIKLKAPKTQEMKFFWKSSSFPEKTLNPLEKRLDWNQAKSSKIKRNLERSMANTPEFTSNSEKKI